MISTAPPSSAIGLRHVRTEFEDAFIAVLSLMRFSSLATMSSASSQLIRTHSSWPRSSFLPPPGSQFLRFIGYFSRSAPKICCCCERPRAQPRICG